MVQGTPLPSQQPAVPAPEPQTPRTPSLSSPNSTNTALAITSVALVRDRGTPEEFQVCRRAVGKIVADILLEIMNPLYAVHPDLKPAGLK